VRHVLELLRTEFDLALAMCGCQNVAEITHDLIA
jgi:isopentenyl diphosphate isomerase/L-lactate dehydrogenase-like FMN-dependent dehydrogenase